MQDVVRAQGELDGAVDRQHQLAARDVAVAGVGEAPGELRRGDVDLERVRADVVVLGEHDRADDRDRRHEHGRHSGPGDLEPGVAVDRRAVAVVVRRGTEADDGEEDHPRDDREDDDRDDRREPVDELDPLHLLGGGIGQPVDQDGHERDEETHQGSDEQNADDRTPAHRQRAYRTP